MLLRAGEVVDGIDDRARPPTGRPRRAATSPAGPARLATCLGLDAATNGVDLCSADSPVRLESMRARRAAGVVAGPRVGITVAAERPWRFWLAGDPTVSAFKAGRRNRRGRTRQTLLGVPPTDDRRPARRTCGGARGARLGRGPDPARRRPGRAAARRRHARPARCGSSSASTRPAADLTLGHAVVLRKLRQFQDFGHTAVLVVGGFTGQVGDPSGRTSTRAAQIGRRR